MYSVQGLAYGNGSIIQTAANIIIIIILTVIFLFLIGYHNMLVNQKMNSPYFSFFIYKMEKQLPAFSLSGCYNDYKIIDEGM